MNYYGIIAFFLVEYLRPMDYLPALKALRLSTVVSLMIVLGTLLTSRRNTVAQVRWNVNFKWMFFYLFLFVVSVFTARVTLYAYETFLNVLGYALVFFVLLLNIDEVRKIRGLFATLIFIHVFVFAVNIETILDYQNRNYLKAGYFMEDGNDFALSVSVVIPFCVYMILSARSRWMKIIYGLALIVLINAVVVTQSRGGALALLATMIYLGVKSRRKYLTLGFISVGIVASMFFISQEYKERMRTIVHYEEEGSAIHRIWAWKSAVRMAVDHPLTGVGAGGFASAYGQLYRPFGVGRTDLPWHNAHSIYFKLLGELGFPGLMAILFILYKNFSLNAKLSRGEPTKEGEPKEGEPKDEEHRLLFRHLSAGLIAFAVGGAFLSGIYYPHLYVIAGLTAAAQVLYGRPEAVRPFQRESG